jgi:hypothetical protein
MRNRLPLLFLGSTLAILSGTAAAHDNVGFSLAIGMPAVTYVQPAPVYFTPPPPRVVYYSPVPVYYGPTARFVYVHRGYGWDRRWHGG